MIFQEKKTDAGYEYKVVDVFGTIVIESEIKLEGGKLDAMVSLLLRQGDRAEVVKGEVKHDQGTVNYTFTKEPQWSEVPPEEEAEWDEQPCENIHTSTNVLVSVFTRIRHWISRILRKLRKSVEVLLEVWKKSE
ncbi:MAG: hypothetical protein Tp172MES00d2C118482111_43 [Prokaryotic dsDNA virus sp.]|nr:MAG: hypothetical protein Tp172MES00d2C118482111_43 [Prokaryotic dsDNA virus sp.]|tara:strand:- start:5351 stop:5752 length:402 start_codon:yes stop_codon:yes gene_type:complete